jgi:hypothetical protein
MPCYTGIVEATVTQRMSIATEAIMSHLPHLSNSILMGHAKLKAEQRSVGGETALTARNARKSVPPTRSGG